MPEPRLQDDKGNFYFADQSDVQAEKALVKEIVEENGQEENIHVYHKMANGKNLIVISPFFCEIRNSLIPWSLKKNWVDILIESTLDTAWS